MDNFEEHVVNFISEILDAMIEYQKVNNITRECISNCVYLMDTVNNYYRSKILKIKAVYAFWFDKDRDTYIICRHMVLEIVGTDIRIDPSYEVFKNKPKYFSTMKEYKDFSQNDKRLHNKKVYEDWIEFIKIANKLNDDENYKHVKLAYKDDIYFDYERIQRRCKK